MKSYIRGSAELDSAKLCNAELRKEKGIWQIGTAFRTHWEVSHFLLKDRLHPS